MGGSATVKVEIDRGSLNILAAASGRGMRAQILEAVARGMERGNLVVLGRAQARRFTGTPAKPFPVSQHRLRLITGHLRKSLLTTKPEVRGDEVRSTMGSNVKYFAVHEFGYQGTAQVRQHVRKNKRGDRKDSAGDKIYTGLAIVRAHQRRMNLPARAPLTTEVLKSERVYARTISEEVEGIQFS